MKKKLLKGDIKICMTCGDNNEKSLIAYERFNGVTKYECKKCRGLGRYKLQELDSVEFMHTAPDPTYPDFDREKHMFLQRTSFKNVSGIYQFNRAITPERVFNIAVELLAIMQQKLHGNKRQNFICVKCKLVTNHKQKICIQCGCKTHEPTAADVTYPTDTRHTKCDAD